MNPGLTCRYYCSNSITHGIFDASIFKICSCALEHLFLPPDPYMYFIMMGKSPFPLFEINTAPACKNRSPGHSFIH